MLPSTAQKIWTNLMSPALLNVPSTSQTIKPYKYHPQNQHKYLRSIKYYQYQRCFTFIKNGRPHPPHSVCT